MLPSSLFSWICDNEPDCGSTSTADLIGVGVEDTSDEDPKMCHGVVSCLSNQFMCKDNATCLPIERFCDGVVDCPGKKKKERIEKTLSSLILKQTTNHVKCLPLLKILFEIHVFAPSPLRQL